MKNLIDIAIKAMFAVAIVALFILHYDSNDAVVYVDSQRLVAGYEGMKVARREFEGKASVWKSRLDTLNVELQNKINDYEKKKATLTANERKLTEDVIRSAEEQFRSYQQMVQENVRREDEELSRKVMDRVNEYLKKYGKQKGYKIIFAATAYGNIVYAESGVDVTDEVMKGLNNEFL
ncbi:MAG TPA: OmpH family outer membrane protein [Cyclobacteriaceae bacterium]|nr:OmpH family outer membrane protein [Cyclobacteriaceae bacterium]